MVASGLLVSLRLFFPFSFVPSICIRYVFFYRSLHEKLLLLIMGMKTRRLKLKYHLYDVFISVVMARQFANFANELLPLLKHSERVICVCFFLFTHAHSLSRTIVVVARIVSLLNDPIPLHLFCLYGFVCASVSVCLYGFGYSIFFPFGS